MSQYTEQKVWVAWGEINCVVISNKKKIQHFILYPLWCLYLCKYMSIKI